MADFSLPSFYPDSLFDPSQNSNQFSAYNNQALPWPSTYVGWPTDSMGRAIQPQRGMTLNSMPGWPSSTPAYPMSVAPNAQAGINQALINAQSAAMQQQYLGADTRQAQGVAGDIQQNILIPASMANWQMQQNPQQQAQGQLQNASNYGGGLSAESYLQLLAHPNYVQTQGATVPQASASSQPSNSVLQQFLANWKPAQSGPGSGFAKGFAAGLGGTGS